MKRSRVMITVFLCTLLLLATAAPALAVSGAVYHAENNTGLGVRIVCTGHANTSTAKAKMVLSFLPNVNHLPENDYSCRVDMVLSGQYTYYSDYNEVNGLLCELPEFITTNHDYDTAFFAYKINNSFYWEDGFSD